MKKIKAIIILFLLFGVSQTSIAQEIDSKYLVSITYIQNNNKLNKEILKTFKRKFSKKKSINFEISKKISFIGISSFEDRLKEKNYLLNADDFYKKNNFKPIDNYFNSLLSNYDTNSIKIHFSKPIDNTLIVELSPRDLQMTSLKLGSVIKILFLFTEKGLIKNVFMNTLMYN